MISVTLLLKTTSNKQHKQQQQQLPYNATEPTTDDSYTCVSNVQVLKSQRVIILNQFVNEPVRFVYNGEIMELFESLESYDVESGSLIIGIPITYDNKKKINNKKQYFKFNSSITSEKKRIAVINEAEDFAARMAHKKNMRQQEERQLARLKDISIDQKIRRNGQIVRRFAASIQRLNAMAEFDHRALRFNFDDDIIENTTPIEPSTDPLPVLW